MANESSVENEAPAAAEATHGTVAHHGKEGADFPPFDVSNFAPQIVWLVLIFSLLYALMSRIALPRVASILKEREHKISSDLDASRELQNKAQAAATENEEKLRATRAQAQAIGRDAQQAAAAQTAAQRAASEQDFAAKLAASDRQIADAKQKALGNVEHIAIEAAGSILEKLTDKRVEPATLADEFRALKSS